MGSVRRLLHEQAPAAVYRQVNAHTC